MLPEHRGKLDVEVIERHDSIETLGARTRAVADYTKAIELDPAAPESLINRGMLYAKQKSYERAIADYDEAASVAPAMINPHYNKAQALERMDRPKEAAAQCRILLHTRAPLCSPSTFEMSVLLKTIWNVELPTRQPEALVEDRLPFLRDEDGPAELCGLRANDPVDVGGVRQDGGRHGRRDADQRSAEGATM